MVWFVLSLQSWSSSESTQQTESRRFVWEQVIERWTLTQREWLWSYTHNFVTDAGLTFWARSTELDLSQYLWPVQLRWTISTIDSWLPIILVTEVVRSSWVWLVDDRQITLQWNSSLFYDIDFWIMLDLWAMQWYEVKRSNDTLVLVDRENNNNEVFTIEWFPCRVWDPLQDCVALEERFIAFNNDSFTNTQWVAFYNLTETTTWFAFYEDITWYSLRATDQRNITTFASLFWFINKDIIETFIRENSQTCRSVESTLESIDTFDYNDRWNWIYRITVQWTSSEGSMATCEIALRIWTPLTLELLSYITDDETVSVTPPVEETVDEISWEQIIIWPEQGLWSQQQNNQDNQQIWNQGDNQDNWEEVTDTQHEQDETPIVDWSTDNEHDQSDLDELWELPDPIAPPSLSVERPDSFDWWLQYTSIRWFVMWFSRQWVSYFWEVLEEVESFEQPWVMCDYKVHVTTWNNAENVASEPDIIVYECTWVAIDTLPENTQYVWSASDKQFIAQWFTNNLETMEIFVEDLPELIETNG